jgi:AcrR family transcriptional regulator
VSADPERVDGRTSRHQHRRPELLRAVADYVLEHGVTEMSLRPMAQDIGVTHATLIRQFGSKQRLIGEVLAHLREDLARPLEAPQDQHARTVREALAELWERFSEPGEQRQFRLLIDVHALALRDPEHYGALLASGVVYDFIAPLQERLRAEGASEADASARATVLLAAIRGLQLDLLATGDRDRVDRAFAALVDALL